MRIVAGVDAARRLSRIPGGTLRLRRWIVAVAAIALCSGLALHLTGTLAPWVDRYGLAHIAPSPVRTAARKHLSQLASRTNVTSAHAQDLAAATEFYDAHSGPLLWVTENGISERGNSVINEIRKADDWGLRARDFAVPQLPAGTVSPEAIAATEIAVTFAVLKYARYARGGRLGDLPSVSKVLDYTPPVRRPRDVLADIAASYAPDAYLRSLHPQHEQFEGLRRLLLKLRRGDATASVEPGRESADMTLTLARILVNMERWRWLPTDLGEFYVWNNVPEFLTRVVRRGETIHSDRIVAGQPEWATPAFSADMKTIVFHPSWGVPDGIRRKELLPRLRDSSQRGLLSLFTSTQSSRALLEQYKLQVTYQGRPIDPDKVDWSTANIGAYEFRQPPGPTNPLGVVKFMFPNKHDVYMHDTPASERDLFARPYRGLSHGCMRVSDPLRLATILLARDKGWSEQQVESLLNGGTREVALTTRIPVHMTYFTAMVDRQGNLQIFADLYGLDTRMGAILFGERAQFVTPRYDDEIRAMRTRHRPSGPSGGSTLAEALASIFSP
jgi:murein L,D-transpeptidase YcbB/YkuD